MLTQHDFYCRCRICKPPLVGERSANAFLLLCLLFALLAGAAVGAIMGAIQ